VALYLLHSDRPLVRSNGSLVQHYLGHTADGAVAGRVEDHLKGRHSARIVQAFLDLGAALYVGRVWPKATYLDEMRIKRNGHLGSHCYLCLINEMYDLWAQNVDPEGAHLRDGLLRWRKPNGSIPPSSTVTTPTSTNGASSPPPETNGTSSSSTNGRSTPGSTLGSV
jgi:hypothetical protein